jgi:hypothetical protein
MVTSCIGKDEDITRVSVSMQDEHSAKLATLPREDGSHSSLIKYFIYENDEKTLLKLVIISPKDIDVKSDRQWRVQVTSTRVSIDYRSSEEPPEAKISGDYQKWRLVQTNSENIPVWRSIDIPLPRQISSADAHTSRDGHYVLLMNTVPCGPIKISTHF